MKLPALEKAKVFGKTVFLRADLDVPLSENGRQMTDDRTQRTEDRKIEDDTRLVAGLLTIEYLLKHSAKVVIAGHLGRPKGIDKSLSLQPVAYWLQGHLDPDLSGERSQWDLSSLSAPRNDKNTVKEIKMGEFQGWQLGDNLFLLENLRFYKGEQDNDSEFTKKLASLADVYVNDAFAVSHRKHASIVGVPKYLPHFVGFRLQKEVEVLSGVLEQPKRPLVVVIGGAKIETKLPLVEKMRDFADYVLVGGKIAKDFTVILKVQHEKVKNRKATLFVADLREDGFDITPKSIDKFLQIVSLAKTVVWNGPVGMIRSKVNPSTSSGLTLSGAPHRLVQGGVEWIKSQKSKVDTEEGTRELTKGIVRSKAYTVVGGGDTVGFLRNLGLLDKFSFVSTGGGAMLEFLSGEKLPGLIALLF